MYTGEPTVLPERWRDAAVACNLAKDAVTCASTSIDNMEPNLKCAWSNRPSRIQVMVEREITPGVKFRDYSIFKDAITTDPPPEPSCNVEPTSFQVHVKDDIITKYRESFPVPDAPVIGIPKQLTDSELARHRSLEDMLAKIDPTSTKPRDGIVALKDWIDAERWCGNLLHVEGSRDTCKKIPVHLIDGDLRCDYTGKRHVPKGEYDLVFGEGYQRFGTEASSTGCRPVPANSPGVTLLSR